MKSDTATAIYPKQQVCHILPGTPRQPQHEADLAHGLAFSVKLSATSTVPAASAKPLLITDLYSPSTKMFSEYYSSTSS